MKTSLQALVVGGLLASGAAGCAAVAVGAGAAGAIAYTDRGATGDVKGSIKDVNERAKSTFKDLGIGITGTQMKESGKEQDLTGKTGSKDITVTMKSTGKDTTKVEVVARESAIKWNKDYAKEVLSKIIQQS